MIESLRRMRFALIAIAVGVSTAPASAGSYRWVAPDGSVSYSDQPPPATAVIGPPVTAPPDATEPPSPPVESERAPVAAPATVEEILQLSGVTRQLPAVSASLATEFKAPATFSPKERAAIERIAERHFHASRLLATITEVLRRDGDQRRLDGVAAWLRSPLGHKITALEVAATLETVAERRGAASPPSAARLALAEQLDWLEGITENRLDGMLAIARATAISIAGALPPEQRKTPAQIDRDLKRARAQMHAEIEQSTVQHIVHQYRTLEDLELERLAAFFASEPGRWYSTAMSRALTQAISLAANETAHAMIGVVPAERWRELAMAPPPAPTPR